MNGMYRSYGPLLFNFDREEDGPVLSERKLQPWLLLVVTAAFVAYALYAQNTSYLYAWLILLTVDFLLEWAVVYFFQQDIIRAGNQVEITGSFWKGTKKYKEVTTLSTK